MKITDIVVEHNAGSFLYSTDRSKLDIPFIHNFLNRSYWAKEIPLETMVESIENSVCIGIYSDDRQVGFARVVTDGATFAWLADVFIDEPARGRGASKFMMEFIMGFDFVPGLRRFMLATLDAHGLYAQYGFKTPARPDRLMEVLQADIYLTKNKAG